MFGYDKNTILESLKGLRFDLCSYLGSTCDCKFGYKSSGKKLGMHSMFDSGEQTGCPELYVVIDLLSQMTDAEFEEILIRRMLALKLAVMEEIEKIGEIKS
jgi:hypothetical protein